jgi:phage shock protein PspC (stress-responsive transcriptional regulator)
MDKTININLGGTLFQIDEEAYKILRDYLNMIDMKFRNVVGGNETIEDIELRIAEIFQSQKGVAGVVTIENVEAMISIIGKPEEFGQTENDTTVSSSSSYSSSSRSRKMFRNPHDTIIGGVCGGIGTYLNTDPVWIRILFIIFALFFGFGFFVYLALWIALPKADTDSKLKEMYGTTFYQTGLKEAPAYQTTSKMGNAFNEIFRAIGKVLFIIVRIFLVILGTVLVIAGFLALLSFIMVFVFKYPGSFSTDAIGFSIAYVPDFINYIVSPAAAPWIKGLIVAVVSLPLLALIYGGVRLVFWFRIRDGYIWLTGIVLWVMCAAALSIILFNEGIGYAETEKVISEEHFRNVPDTLYIISGRKVSDLNTDKEISIPAEEYDIFISEERQQVFIRTSLDIENDENNSASVEIRKHSAGRSRLDAIDNAQKLEYNFKVSGDTLLLDEFFTIPKGKKWSFDYVGVTVRVPEKTVIHMDRTVETLFHSANDEDFIGNPEESFWLMTEDGLSYIGHQKSFER